MRSGRAQWTQPLSVEAVRLGRAAALKVRSRKRLRALLHLLSRFPLCRRMLLVHRRCRASAARRTTRAGLPAFRAGRLFGPKKPPWTVAFRRLRVMPGSAGSERALRRSVSLRMLRGCAETVGYPCKSLFGPFPPLCKHARNRTGVGALSSLVK